ncbi:MAG: methylenetetrahydrofolate reductase [Clostridia bacterium]|nr:methylenetetrahydrofolate reductase [NAD(P)H] [Clostridia bacterium]
MKVIDIIKADKPALSFEVFPPKTTDAFESVKHATEEIAKINPSYMSVTFGAGGSNAGFAVEVAGNLQKNYGVTTVGHLTCVGADRTTINDRLDQMKAHGIENILALRGDRPKDWAKDRPLCVDFEHASDLVRHIKAKGDFCIGGACYPEGHPEADTQKQDIANLKRKVDAGCEFLTTQMFFDNNILYNFIYKLREAGITVPIVAGIMPVTTPKSIARICALSGSLLPKRFIQIVDRFGDNPDAMKQAGIAYATDQIIDLYANGINAVHVYSMNKPDVAAAIQRNLSEIIR